MYAYEGSHSFHKYGDGIASAGDVDGDGIPDFMVGARESTISSTALTPGSITLYSGADGLEIYRIDGTSHNSSFGTVMCSIGDVDGDGAPDFVACDPMYSIGSYTFEGAFWLYSGATGSVLMWETGTASSFFGNSVARLGDLDGDGLEEFAIGAPNEGGGGMVHLYSPGKGGRIKTYVAPDPNSNFGVALASIEDLDGNGLRDFIVGANRFDGAPGNDIGAVYLIGSISGAMIHRYEGWDSLNEFGKVVEAIGDLDGDGLQDVVIAAPHARHGSTLSVGGVEVYSSSTYLPIFSVSGSNANETFGSSIACLDDQDGDGFDDLLIGSPYYMTPWAPGAALLYSGGNGQLLHTFGDGLAIGFGHHVANLQDLDGDGFDDVGVSTPEALVLFRGAARVFGSRKYLSASTGSISAAAGGTLSFDMDFDDAHGGFQYRLLASANGTGPTDINGLMVPLGWDRLLSLSSIGNYPSYVANGEGTLDSAGDGTCVLQLPSGALGSYVGQRLFFATMAGSSLAAPTVVTEAVAVFVDP
jgi:hypothetical protein